MTKQDLSALVAEILKDMGKEPQVKASDYKPADPGPRPKPPCQQDGDFVADVSELDLRKLYLTENPENKEKYQSNIEDERKLFYVALTRAKSNLYISYQLSKKPVSLFVEEMAETDSLIINREDLCYDPREEKRRKCIEHSIKRRISYDIDYSDDITVSIRNEEEHRQNREYWQLVKKAKSKLYDYYGSGARFMPAMYSELSRIKNMDPDDIIAEARRLGMI